MHRPCPFKIFITGAKRPCLVTTSAVEVMTFLVEHNYEILPAEIPDAPPRHMWVRRLSPQPVFLPSRSR